MMPLHTNRHRPPLPSAPLRYDRSMLPDDKTVLLVPRDEGPRHRPPLPSAAAALPFDLSMLPYDETAFLVPRNVHPYGGALTRDQSLASEYSGLNRRFPHYGHRRDLSGSPFILNPVSRRVFAGGHPYGGALSRDQTPEWEYSDLNRRYPRDESTLILDEVSRRVVGGEQLSEEAIAKHMENRVRRHRRNDAVSEEDGGVCVVCLGDLGEENGRIVRLDCGHDFDLNCIKKWLNRSNTCPLCKAAVILPFS